MARSKPRQHQQEDPLDINPLATDPMLKDALQKLTATGPSGFEGLIQRLLEKLTGFSFYLAQSGTQSGRDMSSGHSNATVIAVECKRYGDTRELDITELTGKLTHAATSIESLDIWILIASRTASDQLMSGLEKAAKKLQIEALIFSVADGTPSTLELLCANGAEIALASFAPISSIDLKLLDDELRQVECHPEFARKIEQLRNLVTGGRTYDATRGRLRDWLLTHFNSDTGGRVAFGQVIDVTCKQAEKRLVPRAATSESMDRWLAEWPRNHQGLAVLGEEGDGKTWAVAGWLSDKLRLFNSNFPLVHWLPSHEAVDQDINDLIGRSLTKRLDGEPHSWIERIRRWSVQSSTSDTPLFILVLDGINERHEPQWWRRVLESLSAKPWLDIIAPIVTARSGFWMHLSRIPHIRWNQWEVPAFDDEELKLALHQIGVGPQSLPAEILDLVRKPRYFDLALQHKDALIKSGDVTVARLVYEDWRDRYSRRGHLPDATEFQEVIIGLAKKHRCGPDKLEKREVEETVDPRGDRAGLLRELETGGILVQEGRLWRVESARLALGFGLLLAEMLLDTISQNPEETLASFLEPQSAIDLKSRILENAVLHSFELPAYPATLRGLLTASWLTYRNAGDPLLRSHSAYFPLNPLAYFDAAEIIWKDSTNDSWAEELLRETFMRWADDPRFTCDYVRLFERWLSFVLIDDSSVGKESEFERTNIAEAEAELGRRIFLGQFGFAGVKLIAVDDEGIMRLGRLSLSIISAGDRRPYTRALTWIYLASAVMQHVAQLEICSWIIRTSSVDLWSQFESEVSRLIATESRIARRASYWLLQNFDTAKSLALQAGLSVEYLFPKASWIREPEEDPCSSGFSWSKEDCIVCAGRSDVPSHLMIRNLGKCVQNPEFFVPPHTSQRLVEDFVNGLDPSQMWISRGTTSSAEDFKFDEIELVLAWLCPERFEALVRQVATELKNRQDMDLSYLAERLLNYRLLLSPSELSLARSLWEDLTFRGDLDKEAAWKELWLFELAIQNLTAEEQINCLLRRQADSPLCIHYGSSFQSLEWATALNKLREFTEPKRIVQVLFFLSANVTSLDTLAAEDLVDFTLHADSAVRSSALRILYIGGFEAAAMRAISGKLLRDYSRDTEDENHWQSLIIAKWGAELPFESLSSRVELVYLGQVIKSRCRREAEVIHYAELLDAALGNLAKQNFDSHRYPAIEVRTPANGGEYGSEYISVVATEPHQKVIFSSRSATWGGHGHGNASRESMMRAATITNHLLYDRLDDILSQQREAGNHWFVRPFSCDCLKEIVEAKPELVTKWIGDSAGDSEYLSQTLGVARSFFEAICTVLLSEQPERGAALYRYISANSGPVHFVSEENGIPLLDFGLFAARPSIEVVELWNDRLDGAKSDYDLLTLSIVARSDEAKKWLIKRTAVDSTTGTQYQKARAMLLYGFLDSDSTPPDLLSQMSDGGKWQLEQRVRALGYWQANSWARSWFKRFGESNSNAAAAGAFRCFLENVDSRYYTWREKELPIISERKSRFLSASESRIRHFIRQSEMRFKRNFLGMRVSERQVWPWL